MPRSLSPLLAAPQFAAALPFAAALAFASVLAGVFAAAPAGAQLLLLPGETEPAQFPVSQLELVYADAAKGDTNRRSVDRTAAGYPDLSNLVPVVVELARSEDGFTIPRGDATGEPIEIGGPGSPPVQLDASALARVLRTLVEKVHALGFYGIDIRPAASEIDLETEQDLRPAGRQQLRLVVRIGRIDAVRSIAAGDRISDEWKIDHELHERLRDESPLQPSGQATEDSTNLLNRRALEDYLYRLNRHSGRRVEAALSPAEEPGGVVVDYRVFEARPWFVYGQVSNTGTRRTSIWQTRIGAVHRQLTNRDDVLSFEYLNGGDDVNGARVAYQAPFFRSKRPDWMNRRKGDPEWIAWLPREKIPWWGVDRLRWEVDASWGRFEADRTTSPIFNFANDAVVSSQIQAGTRLIYEAFQHRDFFLDVWAGLRVRHYEVQNKIVRTIGEETFVYPRIGLHGERINAVSNLNADLSFEGQVREGSEIERNQLGRVDVDSVYASLNYDLGYSTYLEPLLFPKQFLDPKSRLSSTLAHEVAFGTRGQYIFDDKRLIPQASQVIGGAYSVRGFRQSQAVGDSIFIASAEYRFHVPRLLPIQREPLNVPVLGDFRAAPQQIYGRPDWDFTLRAFVDFGRAIRNANNASGVLRTGNFEDDETLVGAGFGAELQFRSNLRARVDWATPLTSTSESDSGAFGEKSELHVLFSVLY